MDAIKDIGDTNQHQQESSTDDDCPKTVQLNGDAAAFVPSECGDHSNQTYGTFTLKVPLESRIWGSISAFSANTHRLSTVNRKSAPHLALSTKLFPKLQFNHSLMINISPDGLISVRRRDNISDNNIDVIILFGGTVLIYHWIEPYELDVWPNKSMHAYPNDSRVDVVAFDGSNQNNMLRYAKLWQKGISFMAKDVPVVYLVDEAGLRSSIDHFIHIKKDCAMAVFNNKNPRHTSYPFDEAANVMQKLLHTKELHGSEVIEINQVRITSHNDGNICVERMNKACCIRINPRKSAITLRSACIHATASMGKSPHMFLRQGDRRIHFDGAIFSVRNGGYSAGFDEKNQVTIFNKKLN